LVPQARPSSARVPERPAGHGPTIEALGLEDLLSLAGIYRELGE
jgi:hypothetical protein